MSSVMYTSWLHSRPLYLSIEITIFFFASTDHPRLFSPVRPNALFIRGERCLNYKKINKNKKINNSRKIVCQSVYTSNVRILYFSQAPKKLKSLESQTSYFTSATSKQPDRNLAVKTESTTLLIRLLSRTQGIQKIRFSFQKKLH